MFFLCDLSRWYYKISHAYFDCVARLSLVPPHIEREWKILCSVTQYPVENPMANDAEWRDG